MAQSPIGVHHTQRRVYLIACCIFFVSILGCGDKRPAQYPVSGKVTYQGRPVPLGTIIFYPAGSNGAEATGTIAEDGTYKLVSGSPIQEGARPGGYRILVQSVEQTGGRAMTLDDLPPKERKMYEDAGEIPYGTIGNPRTVWHVPMKYFDRAASPHKETYTVEAKDANVINIEL